MSQNKGFMSQGLHTYQSNQNQDFPTVLQRIAQGDLTAVEECLKVYEKLIWNFSLRFTNNLADAQDLVQEIFIDIWKSAGDFDAAKSPEWAFIKLIAKRRLCDYLRKCYRSPQIISSEEIREEKADNYHTKLQTLIEIKSAIAALNKLKPIDNRLIRMSIFEGFSHDEIAEKISLPLGTVKTRIRRGIKTIRSSFKFPKIQQKIVL